MALILSKTLIEQNQTVNAWHVTQSIDAFTGAKAYDITISGSLTLTGSVNSANGYTGSLLGNAFSANTASWAVNATNTKLAESSSKEYIASNATTNTEYNLVFKNSTAALNDYHQLGADGTNGPFYNPSSNTLTVPVVSGSSIQAASITGSLSGSVAGTASFAVSASYAATASIASSATSTATVTGYYIPSGSIVASSGILKMFAGAGKIPATPPFIAIITVSPVDLTGKILNQNLFLGIAPSQSGTTVSATVNSPTSITFESSTANTDFTFIATYI